MADPTNRNDPAYANNPNYVWSGGRWQYVSNPSTANNPASAASGTIRGESLGTPGGFADVGEGLFNWLQGKPPGAGQGVISPPQITNGQAYQNIARQNATRQQAVNPYNAGIADQSRAAQLALLAQMRAMQQGPSLAALQTQRALAQSGQSALAAAAMGAPGRAAMMQAGQVGGGLAGDAGQARLAEVMRMQAAQGGLAGGLRGNDLNSAGYQSQNGLAAARQDEALRQMYAQAGMNLQNARDQALTNRQVTYYQLLAKKNAQDMDLVNKTMQSGAGLMGTAATAGGKK